MLARFRAHPGGRAPFLAFLCAIALAACSSTSTPSPSVTTPRPTPTVSPSPTPTLAPTPTPVPTANPFAARRVTLLILGSDSTPSRVAQGLGKLTDSIIVVSVNAARTQVSMISFPRDIVDIPLGNGGTWGTKLNAISYYLGEPAMKRAISATLRQPIDYYVEINMIDFARLVNGIGGIEVNVPHAIDDASINLHIKAGPHFLDGAAALKLARSRHTSSDWDRAARQQLIVAAIVRKMVDPDTKIGFFSLLATLTSMKTDLPLDHFGALFELARQAAGAKIVGKVLAPPQFTLFSGIEKGTGRGYIEEPNIAAIRAYAASVMGGK